MAQNHLIIEEVCNALEDTSITKAKRVIEDKYPFIPFSNAGRKCSDYQKMMIFIRDGFIDRYSGKKMIFPPVLRLLSCLMPDEFPFQKNWKMSECHLAYWQLLPTIDHIVPVSRGGEDEESNWVCTSQLRNSAKSNLSIEELGWQLHAPGSMADWDGQLKWYMAYVNKHSDILGDNYMRSWHGAAMRAIKI